MKPRKPINKVSKKQSLVNQQLERVKRELDQDMWEAGTHYCICCGTVSALTHSHLSTSLKLKCVKANLTLMCQPCHALYENHNMNSIHKLGNYEKVLALLKFVDIAFYNKIVNKG
jgi:hypothetical protein